MNRYVYCLSIFANLVFVAFLGWLIYSPKGALLWVRHLNQFWFFLGAVGIIVLAAILAPLLSGRDGPTPRGPQEDGSGPAKELAGQARGGQ
jgi:hypothetical protein